MNLSNFKLLFFTLFISGLTLASCGNKSNTANKDSKEYTSAYICPMHCDGSGSDVAGKCPVCGMDYVKNENHTYACPMHPEVTGMKGDKCSKCGMDLTLISGDDHKGHNH